MNLSLTSMSDMESVSVQSNIGRNYDPDNYQYRCCCGRFKSKYGSLAIGLVDAFVIIFLLLVNCTNVCPVFRTQFVPEEVNDMAIYLIICSTLFGILILIHGVFDESRNALMMFLILQTMAFIFTTLFLFNAIVMMLVQQPDTPNVSMTSPTLAVCLLLIAQIVQIWLLIIVVSCYKMIRDKKFGQPSADHDLSSLPPTYSVAYMYPSVSQARLAAINDLPTYSSACSGLVLGNLPKLSAE